MKLIAKTILSFVFLFPFFFLTSQEINAGYTVSSCNAILAADSQLAQRVTTLQEIGDNNFSPANLFVAYPIDCDSAGCDQGNPRTTIPFRTGWWFTPVPGVNLDASNISFTNIGGQNYIVGSINLNNNLGPDDATLLVRLWNQTSGYLCNETTIPITGFTESCTLDLSRAGRRADNTYVLPVTINPNSNNFLLPGQAYYLQIDFLTTNNFSISPGQSAYQIGFDSLNLNTGRYRVCVRKGDFGLPPVNELPCGSPLMEEICGGEVDLSVALPLSGTEFPDPDPDASDGSDSPAAFKAEPFNLCAQIPEASLRSTCQSCLSSEGLWTALGCINFQNNGANIIRTLITLGLSLGGGFTLLIILFAGFTLSTSQGDPKRVSEAKELITSAVIGLLFIIFSVTILQFIGVSLFRIPGFGG